MLKQKFNYVMAIYDIEKNKPIQIQEYRFTSGHDVRRAKLLSKEGTEFMVQQLMREKIPFKQNLIR